MAAKSLMRFKDSEGAKAEYVLVGTLLSLCVAMICAMGVKGFVEDDSEREVVI